MVKYAPDMDDQNLQNQKPQLSLEEELDVLEAVYKIGMEKGLELLRPEQVKKLEDGGRITKGNGGEIGFKTRKLSDVGLMASTLKKNSFDSRALKNERLINFLIRGLRLKIENELREDRELSELMDKLKVNQKSYLISCFFRYFYGVGEIQFKQALME